MHHFSIGWITLGLLATAQTGHANLLLNGSFEDPGYLPTAGTFNGATGYFVELISGSTSIDHWTVVGPSGQKAVNWNLHTVNEGQSGNYSLFFSPNGYIDNFVEQTFATTPGQTYDVDLIVTTSVGGELLQVSADGQVQPFEVLGLTPIWQPVHWQFVADNATATLSLGKISNGTHGSPGFVLDDVSVQLTSGTVPEPSTWVVGGLSALLIVRGTRSRSRIRRSGGGVCR